MYSTGHVKRNPATGEVALRTHFPEDPELAGYAWTVCAPNVGARSTTTSEVEGWTDLFIPSEGGS